MAKAAQLDMLAGVEETEPPGPIADAAYATWNECAKRFGWVTALKNGHGRPAKLRRAVKELGGLHQWRTLLEKCGTSDFLCGRSHTPGRKPFSFDLDWALKPANLLRLEEGKYFSDETRAAAPTDTFSQKLKPQGIDWRGTLERYKPRGFWHKDTMGPRPEEPGPHKVPADMLEAWRKKHGITGVQAPTETREQRLAASIATFRRLGDYARANAAEEQLATLQGRPPELVPAPDARNPDVVPPKMPSNKGYSGHTAKNGGNYSKPMQRSEAAITRAMAAAQDAAWEDIPECENYGRDE